MAGCQNPGLKGYGSAGGPVNVGLGSYPVVSLAEAREKALENRQAVAQGRDPQSKPSDIPTFEDAAERVIALHEPTWRGRRAICGDMAREPAGLRLPEARAQAGFRHQHVGRDGRFTANLE